MWKRLMKELNLSDSYISMGLGLLVVIIVGVLLFNYFSNTSKPSISETGEQTESESTSAETTPLDFPRTHIVSAGDTLWTIAEKYYKSGYNWVDIANENNLADANNIEEGAQIIIPDVTPIATPVTDSQLAEAEVTPAVVDEVSTTTEAETTTTTAESYTVVHGDFLWAIAEKMYNDGYKWVEIAKANNLENPDVIHAGNVLVIPR